jgi:hypothetical protein
MRIWELLRISGGAQLRAEFLSVFTRHQFSGIDTNSASPLFGQVTGVDMGTYRQTQIGVRVDF